MNPSLISKKTTPIVLTIGCLLPGLALAQTALIDANTRNGSFELLGAPPGAVNAAKAKDWDTDPAGDVTYWTQFPGVTVRGDSGTETGATTTGAKWAFLQAGNATYNLTDHVIQAGDTFTFLWDSYTATSHNLSLVYALADGTLMSLGTAVGSTAAGTDLTGTFTVAPGDPAIGKTVGINITAVGGYPQVDNIRLVFTFVKPGDSDNDGLPDTWEISNFGNLDETAGSDPDHDGLINSYELATSFTAANRFDSDGDSLGDGAELGVGLPSSNAFARGVPTNPLLADSDRDGVSDFEENGSLNIHPLPVPPATTGGGGPTNPNSGDTDGDAINDYDELAYHSNPNDPSSTPDPALHELINNQLQNGDFELRNGLPNTAKTTQWDAPAPNDIDYWTEWAGVSTVADNSGVEGGGSHGAMRGYFRSGNAAYNLTQSVAAAGNVYACTWKQVSAGGSPLSVQLVYEESPGFIKALPASLATTSTVGGIGHLVHRIPVGSPAIGHKIGIGVSSVGNWIGADEFVLNIADGDSDGDGLGDFFEDEFFGNNDGIPTPAELALQTAAGDFDLDGLTNSDEAFFGTRPDRKDSDNDGLADGAELAADGVESSNKFARGEITNPLATDSDHDGVTDKEENGELNLQFDRAATNPNSADTDGDGVRDNKELAYGSDPNDEASVPAPVVISLIDNQRRNGSFEIRNGAPNTVKTNQWDAAAPDDIDNWKEWLETSAEHNDSGVEAGGTDGAMRGFFQSGNAAYNMTDSIAAEGSIYAASWKHTGGTGLLAVQLVYDDGLGHILGLPASLASTTGPGGVGDLVYRIPAGSPAIGKTIGLGVTSSGGFMQADEFSLNIAATDSDHDALADAWETGYFGNLAQGPAGDPDGDGSDNLTEFRLGLDPTSGNSVFKVTRSATGALQWPTGPGTTFQIQRSITLLPGSWSTLEAAYSGSSYTDPEPPAGKAFYKIGLNP